METTRVERKKAEEKKPITKLFSASKVDEAAKGPSERWVQLVAVVLVCRWYSIMFLIYILQHRSLKYWLQPNVRIMSPAPPPKPCTKLCIFRPNINSFSARNDAINFVKLILHALKGK